MENLKFSLLELVALIGLTQSVAVLVYIIFRSGDIKHAVLPVLYFCVIGSAFYAEFARLFISEYETQFVLLASVLWACVPTLSALLVVQMVRIPDLPPFGYYSILLIPLILIVCGIINTAIFPILSVVLGAFALLTIWIKRDMLTILYKNTENAGHERYWLSIALIFFNVMFLSGVLLEELEAFQDNIWNLLRLILSNAFVYLASTSLFRIYPQAVLTKRANLRPEASVKTLSNSDQDLLDKIIGLFEVEKVYQENQLTRMDIAQELKISESQLSRLVTHHYKKSVPQVINYFRVQDALVLLKQTDEPIKDVAIESGFSSIATFNRVFKEVVGHSPSKIRAEKKNIIH